MSGKKPVHFPIALSFDLEFWWCSELVRGIELSKTKDIIEEASILVLDLLGQRRSSATFFILGSVAEKYPGLVKLIHSQGHEIASHGYSHRNVFELSPQEFEEDLRKSTEILTSLAGARPVGYRAPNFSFDQRTAWAYEILNKHGYLYSSSIFPFKTRLYGVPKAPLSSYPPSLDDICLADPEGAIIEFPATVLQAWGKNIPVSGGFYFRLLPVPFTCWALKQVIKKRPAVFYLHLRDIYQGIPRVKSLPRKAYFFHYFGLKKSLKKFEYLLESFSFQTVREALGLC